MTEVLGVFVFVYNSPPFVAEILGVFVSGLVPNEF
jgi:hypothetical protein